MTFTTIQKLIKIGTSQGVTLPAKELRKFGSKLGDEVVLRVEPVSPKLDPHTVEVVGIARDLIERHRRALDNLSQR